MSWPQKSNNRRVKPTTIRTHNGLHFADVDFKQNEPRFLVHCKGKQDYITMSELQQKVEEARQKQA